MTTRPRPRARCRSRPSYLVVGAGASGMAFTDALASRSDADIVLVDRQHRPGGHWNDDYGFVRLHQPSAYYGVDSLPLGADRIDTAGPNDGFYERASGAEVCEYYDRVLTDRLIATGQVRFYPMTDYNRGESGEHTLTSLLTDETISVRVRRRLVDATYIATTIPSMHEPSFSVDPGVRLIAPYDLVQIGDPASSFTHPWRARSLRLRSGDRYRSRSRWLGASFVTGPVGSAAR